MAMGWTTWCSKMPGTGRKGLASWWRRVRRTVGIDEGLWPASFGAPSSAPPSRNIETGSPGLQWW